MTFLDAFNGWSALHLLGSFILTTALGTTSLGPLQVGIIGFGLGASWEVVADQELRLNDPRGGDYYDLLWDFAGCAAGVLALELSADSYRPKSPLRLQLPPMRDPPASLGSVRYRKISPFWALKHSKPKALYPINIHEVGRNFSLGVRWPNRTFSAPGTTRINQDNYALLVQRN